MSSAFQLCFADRGCFVLRSCLGCLGRERGCLSFVSLFAEVRAKTELFFVLVEGFEGYKKPTNDP